MKGWSGYQNSPMPQDKTLSEEQKKTIAKTAKEEWVGDRADEGSEESQLLILKKQCKEKGGTWNSKTNSCSKIEVAQDRKYSDLEKYDTDRD